MSLSGIVHYVGRAAAFALPTSLILYGLRRLRHRGERLSPGREVLVFLFFLYAMALISITAIRDGAHLLTWWRIPHTADTIQLTPILETLKQGRAGAWYLIYPVAGNIAWFVPLGLLLGCLRPRIGLGKMALLSAGVSLAIEVIQWVLMSGISDIDDVIFNTVGGILGWTLSLCFRSRK